MSEHKQDLPQDPIDLDDLMELVGECESIVKSSINDAFLRLEAMKVIYKHAEGELKHNEVPDEETLEVMRFLGFFEED